MTCPVWLYVLRGVPPRYQSMFHELGFRPSRHGNWWRHYDDRLPGITLRREAAREHAERLGIALDIKPQRAAPYRKRSKRTLRRRLRQSS